MPKTTKPLSDIVPQFIIDKTGKKTGVILDIKTYERLIEEVEDIYFGSIAKKALQKDKEYIEHNKIKKEVKR